MAGGALSLDPETDQASQPVNEASESATGIVDNGSGVIPQKGIGRANGYYQYHTVTVNMTVTCVNDTPTITNISNQSTNEDVNKVVAFTVNDVETSNGSLTLSRTSSNSTLLPTGNITFGGSGSSRTVTLKPVANKYGSSTVGITVSDGSKTRTDTFVLTVNSVNDTPTITNISNQSTNEDVNKVVAFTVNDVETSNGSLTLSRTSSNSTLLPTGNITFGGSGSSRTVTLKPVANKYGSSTVGITVSDGSKTRTDTFVLTVNSVNDTPTITNISNQSTNEDVNKVVAFTVNDVETSNGSLTLSRTSSNSTLLPTGNITFGGSGSSRTVTLKPVANKYGSSTVGITVSDGSKTRTDTFVLTVNSVNDLPSISAISDKEMFRGKTLPINFTVNDLETSNASLTVTAVAANEAVLPQSDLILGGAGSSRTLTLAPGTNGGGTTNVTVTVKDGNNDIATSVFSAVIKKVPNEPFAHYGGSTPDSTYIAPSITTTDYHGTVPGQAGVSGGQASYSIPINMAPGRNGMQPNVSLSYNSQGGNGVVGMGWSLSAYGSITRCPATNAQDWRARSVQLDGEDKLCLNGQRLIRQEGIYGANGAVYRTEMDSFAKVVQSGSLASAGASFVVYTKDGSVSYYGGDANSRVTASGSSLESTWLLTRQQDVSGNNHVNYHYASHGAGEVLLDYIAYTGNSASVDGDRVVEFEYETRNDKSHSYFAGGLTTSTKRLSLIRSKVGATTYWTYDLDYIYSSYSSRSLLDQVTLTDKDGNTTSPTTFNWFNSNAEVELTNLTYLENGADVPITDSSLILSKVLPRGDVNGDGVRDWNGVFVNAEGEKTGDNTNDLKNCQRVPISRTFNCIEADFNLDGLSDGWSVSNGKMRIELSQYASDQKTYVNTDVSITSDQINDLTDHIKHIADYNGDSLLDIMVYEYNGNAPRIRYYEHTGSMTSPYTGSGQIIYNYRMLTPIGSPASKESDIQFMGDLDGNGYPDIVLTDTYHNTMKVGIPQPYPSDFMYTKLVNGVTTFETVSAPAQFDVEHGNIVNFNFFSMFFDINGDGLSDVIGFFGDTSQLHVMLNKGKREFASPVAIGGSSVLSTRSFTVVNARENVGVSDEIPFSTPRLLEGLKVADIDLDGRPELVFPGQRHITSCATINVANFGGGFTQQTFCGDALYGDYRQQSGSNATTLIDVGLLDDSIYSFRAMHFDVNNSGNFSASITSTPYIGSARESQFVDATGNGLMDFVFAYGKRAGASFYPQNPGSVAGMGTQGFYINKNHGAGTKERYEPVDLMLSATNGDGLAANWGYRPLSSDKYNDENGDFYDLDFNYTGQFSAGNGEYLHFGSSMYVVAKFDQDNGVSGQNSQTYKYKGAVYNVQGRGFQGFREIQVTDHANRHISNSKFHQIFPYTGQLERTEKYAYKNATDTQLIEEVDYHVLRNSNHATSTLKLFHMYNYTINAKRYALNSGSLLLEQLNEIRGLDKFGNVSQQRTRTIEHLVNPANDASYTQTKEIVSKSYFNNDESVWWINKLDSQETENFAVVRSAGDPLATTANTLDSTKKVTVTFSNYNEHRKPESVLTSANDSDRTLAVISDFNAYGLPNWVEQQGQVLNGTGNSWVNQIRKTNYTYSKNGTSSASDGYFPFTVTNAKGHVTTTTTDLSTGQPLSVTDTNNVTISTEYDGWGRPKSVNAPGAPKQHIVYRPADTDAPNLAIWQKEVIQAGTPKQIEYIDVLGRALRTSIESFEGGSTYLTDMSYNQRGLTVFESVPYKENGNVYGTHYTEYDALGRLTAKSVDQADGTLSTTYTHSGYTTTISAGSLPDMKRFYNGSQQLIWTEDAQGGITQYAYNAAGSPIVIRDANGNNIKALYNGLGHKLSVDDPNMGTTVFANNSFGEVELEHDANGDKVSYTYDVLGRVMSRYTQHTNGLGSSTATFVWDNLGTGCKIGLLCRENENGMMRAYQYDTQLRVKQTTLRLDNVDHIVATQYDNNYGRPKALVYPNGLTIAFEYNDRGYLAQEKNAASGYVFREVTAMDAFGNITANNLTNDQLSGTYYFAPQTGQMRSSIVDGAQRLHHLYYDEYDIYGNIKVQSNLQSDTSESFDYDVLQRLEQNTAIQNGMTVQVVNYRYDALGNFQYKSDFSQSHSGAYQYGNTAKSAGGNAGPNAVRRVSKPSGTVNYAYDNKGNMLSGDSLTATYTAFIKPASLTKNGTTSAFAYGSDRMRYKQVTGGKTTYYIDKLFEVEGNDWRAYISDVAVIHFSDTEDSANIRYTHKDRLGSTVTMTNDVGLLSERRRFDPFGKPGAVSGSQLSDFGTDYLISKRGFTDHEHLDEQELIHMNGRVYDYNLGRFSGAGEPRFKSLFIYPE